MGSAQRERKLLTPEQAARGLRHMRGMLFASALWICVGIGWCAALSPRLAPWLVAFGILYLLLWLPIVLRIVERDIAGRTSPPSTPDVRL